MWKDFRAFIARGNVVDLAVGVIIGAAFTTVVKSMTDGIIMPVVGIFTGKIDFKNKVVNLGEMPVATGPEIEAAQAAKQPLIMYGQFLNDVITFLIVAVIMFFVARYAVRLFAAFEPPEAPPTKTEILLEEIRDLLKAKA